MVRAILLSTLIAFSFNSSFAKIWRVNNNSNVSANFTSLQQAHDGAQRDDTLHLEGSPNSYGRCDIRKKLVIIGTGYFLSENPNTQALIQTAKASAINFYDGSSGSVIMGVELTENVVIYEDDIRIIRNKFVFPYDASYPEYYQSALTVRYQDGTNSTPVNNVIISQNYGLRISIDYASTGIIISNNYITVGGNPGESTNGNLAINANAQVIVQNNIFRRGQIIANANTVFTNNIMYTGSLVGGGHYFSNNISNGNQFGSANDNKSNVDMSSVFVGLLNGLYADNQLKLKPGSPATGAGYGSTTQIPIDAGIYSGQTPYILSGIPPVPAIYSFINDPIGSNADPIEVKIKVKSGG